MTPDEEQTLLELGNELSLLQQDGEQALGDFVTAAETYVRPMMERAERCKKLLATYIDLKKSGRGGMSKASTTPNDLMAPNSVAASTMDSTPGLIPINNNDERVDLVTRRPTPAEWTAYHLRSDKKKLCNAFYLGGNCSFASCKLDHSAIEPGVYRCLQFVLKEMPCKWGGNCRRPSCYYGHTCQRIGCKGSKHKGCKMKNKTHAVDKNTAQWVPPGDLAKKKRAKSSSQAEKPASTQEGKKPTRSGGATPVDNCTTSPWKQGKPSLGDGSKKEHHDSGWDSLLLEEWEISQMVKENILSKQPIVMTEAPNTVPLLIDI